MEKEKIKFRIDKSNFEDKYTRNFLRLKIIPKLKKINPTLEQTFFKNSRRFNEESSIVQEYILGRLNELVAVQNNSSTVSRLKLKKEKYAGTLLHSWLAPLGFSETQQRNILSAVCDTSTEAKYFITPTHKLMVSRNEIMLVVNEEKIIPVTTIASLKELKDQSFFKVSTEKQFVLPTKKELYLSEKELIFPLLVRAPHAGEKFRPFGMKGFKLLSDFIKDEKIDAINKENVRLLVNGNGEIIWVIGYRSDERYRINKEAKKFLKLTLK